MNLRWRESVKYARRYASSKGCVEEIRKKDRERERERERDRNKHYESRMLKHFDINLINGFFNWISIQEERYKPSL